MVLDLNHVDIAAISETWFKDDTEPLGTLAGFNSFTRNRSVRDCGGVAILIKDHIPASTIRLEVPQDLEVLWVLARPRWLPRQVSALVICAVYLPTKAVALTVQKLTDHLTTSLMLLTKRYNSPLFMIMGDFNPTSTPFKASSLTKPCKLRQVVGVPTRGISTLDYIFTNGSHWYNNPVSLPPLGRSDHNAVLWVPLSLQPTKQAPKIRSIRKFPDSRLREFGTWITHHDWDEVISSPNVDAKVREFQNTLRAKVDFSFPLQRVSQHPTDKPWMSTNIKELIRDRQRAHAMCNLDLRKALAKKIIAEIRLAKAKFFKEKIALLHNVSPAKWFRHISSLTSTQPNDSKLLSIPEVACDIDAASDTINDHFSRYNNAIPPLDQTSLPGFLPPNKPTTTTSNLDVYHLLKSLSPSKAPGPGDIPLRLMIEFAPELTCPLTDIYNCSLQHGVFPSL
ncbi:MAG: endonuclease/exonuclease/phosphatase family protein, partial [Cyanobacteria bacterium J06553_1]